MRFLDSLRRAICSPSLSSRSPRRPGRRPRLLLETLEDRAVPSVTLFSSDTQYVGLLDITTDGTTGFYLSGYNTPQGNGQQIFKVPMSGGNASVLAPAINPHGLASDGTYVYWIDPNGDPDATAIFRVTIGSGTVDKIYSGFATGQPVVDGSGLALVPGAAAPGTLIAADEVQGRVVQMTASNPVANITQLGPNRFGGFFNEEHQNKVTVDNGIVYIADGGNSLYTDTPPRIESIPVGGNTFTTLYTGSLPGFSPQGIAVHGGTVYMTSGNQILQMPTAGGTPTVLATDSRFGSLLGLTYYNNALYVEDQHAGFGEVWKVDVNVGNPFAGSYLGSFSGTATGVGAVSGAVAFTVDEAGVITVTTPGNGHGQCDNLGNASVTFVGGLGSVQNVSYTFSGTIVQSAPGVDSAQGTWSASFTGGTGSGTWTATTQSVPAVVVNDAGGPFTGNPYAASATATGSDGKPVSGSFSFLYYTGTSASGTGSSTPPTDTGTYTVVASFTSSNSHYTDAQSGPATFSIYAATPTISFAASYNGSYTGAVVENGHTQSVSGAVAFSVNQFGVITVTNPGTGTGSLTQAGAASFASAGGFGSVGDVSYTFTGSFGVSSTGVGSASGSWTATFDGGSGAGSWSASSSNHTLTQVAQEFTHSAENFSHNISQIYENFLGRAPDNSGLQYWVGRMQNGLTDEQLESSFIGSPEYIANHGGTGQNWVIGMYNDLLGRTPDADGLQYWVNRLANGALPSDVAFGFAASAEREGIHVQANYQIYLGRIAGADEVDYWVSQFVSGAATNETLAGQFLASPEYFTDPEKGHGDLATWVNNAYFQVLSRTPGSSEVAYWLSVL